MHTRLVDQYGVEITATRFPALVAMTDVDDADEIGVFDQSASGLYRATVGDVISKGTYNATEKTTPVSNDIFPIADSEASNAIKKVKLSSILASAGGTGNAPQAHAGSLSLVSNVPMDMSKGYYQRVFDGGTLYYVPIGPKLYLREGGAWVQKTFDAQISQACTAFSIDTFYDIFVYDSGGGTLAFNNVAWTRPGVRATALTNQDGVWLKSGDTAKRYIGSVFCTTTTQKLSVFGVGNTEVVSVQDMRDPEYESMWFGPESGWSLPWNIIPLIGKGYTHGITRDMSATLLTSRLLGGNSTYDACFFWTYFTNNRLWMQHGASIKQHEIGGWRATEAGEYENTYTSVPSYSSGGDAKRVLAVPSQKKIIFPVGVDGGTTPTLEVFSSLTANTPTRTSVTTSVVTTNNPGVYVPTVDKIFVGSRSYGTLSGTPAVSDTLTREYKDMCWCPLNDRIYAVADGTAVYKLNPASPASETVISPASAAVLASIHWNPEIQRIVVMDNASNSNWLHFINPLTDTVELRVLLAKQGASRTPYGLGWCPLSNRIVCFLSSGGPYAFPVQHYFNTNPVSTGTGTSTRRALAGNAFHVGSYDPFTASGYTYGLQYLHPLRMTCFSGYNSTDIGVWRLD